MICLLFPCELGSRRSSARVHENQQPRQFGHCRAGVTTDIAGMVRDAAVMMSIELNSESNLRIARHGCVFQPCVAAPLNLRSAGNGAQGKFQEKKIETSNNHELEATLRAVRANGVHSAATSDATEAHVIVPCCTRGRGRRTLSNTRKPILLVFPPINSKCRIIKCPLAAECVGCLANHAARLTNLLVRP